VRDGELWGRGAVDMKGSIGMVLAVLRDWAARGHRPRREIVLAFTADEEDTARYGSAYLAEHHAGLFDGCTEAIGESGGYTVHAAPGVRVYPLGAGERGTAWLRLTARGRAGHGSRAGPDNAVRHLADALSRIGGYDWPVRPTPVVAAAVAGLVSATGRADPLAGGAGEAAGDGLAARLAAAFGPAAALVQHTLRNSANPTMLQAGYKVNVVPEQAHAWVDGRVLPGLREEFEQTLDALTGQHVSWEYLHREPALAAPLESPTVAAMRAALLAADPGAHVVPYCMAGGTDAKQFSVLGIAGYGFMPLRLPPGYDYHAMFHGVDERVPVSALHFGTRVLDEFLSRC
jgi:acetylornithine deacetylase/succinyl-diaminopimelate desuccinylase-like protein